MFLLADMPEAVGYPTFLPAVEISEKDEKAGRQKPAWLASSLRRESDAVLAESARRERLRQLQAGIGRAEPADDRAYLYGQQPVADLPATAYFVFEVRDRQVTGAFYMPSSSFDCVRGRIEAKRLALTVTDSYSQATYPYDLALGASAVEVASEQPNRVLPLAIEGFHPLPIGDRDREILAVCQAANQL